MHLDQIIHHPSLAYAMLVSSSSSSNPRKKSFIPPQKTPITDHPMEIRLANHPIIINMKKSPNTPSQDQVRCLL